MYFNIKTKQKKNHSGELKGFLVIIFSFLFAYCLIVPQQAGALGPAVFNITSLIFGKAGYALPFLLMLAGWGNIRPPKKAHCRIDVIFGVVLISALASFFQIFANSFYSVNDISLGGWIGVKLYPLFLRLFGNWISLIVSAGISIYCASRILRLSLRNISLGFWHKLSDDFSEWEKARAELIKATPSIKETSKSNSNSSRQKESLPPATAAKAPEKTEPKIITPAKGLFQPRSETKKPAPRKAGDAAQEIVPAQAIHFNFDVPTPSLLQDTRDSVKEQSKEEHLANAALLTKTLKDFDIDSKVLEIIPGPVVTRYDIELAPGIKVQAVVALSENISLAMKRPAIRVISIPEKSAVGVEVPNAKGRLVGLKELISGPEYSNSKSLLTLALGRTTDGHSYVTELDSMPHLLIAGATGSGKSVCIHSVILSILFKARPDEVKLLLIDPKRLELPVYRGLPHLYDPRVTPDKVDIITQPRDAAESLKRLVKVMEERYERFAMACVRNIEGYNEKMASTGGKKEFYIIVIIDELADLMLIATKEVEDSIQRLAQMARAVGIHLILATQRPSVDVITGVIKANFPARIAFQTTSKVDSRVILDMIGADALLGRGDMLFLPPGESKPYRLQGAFVSVAEAESIVKYIKDQKVPPSYEATISGKSLAASTYEKDEDDNDLIAACKLVMERKRVSQDLLKAHFGSSARATNLLSLLEMKGFIHKPEGTNRWTIYFAKIDEYLNSSNQSSTESMGQFQ